MNVSKFFIAAFAATAISSTVFAGATGGPKGTKTSVNANSTDTFPICFNANEKAIVALKGDGDTDLDLYIYDENGRLITQDIDNNDACLAEWTPKWTGKFYIRVVNRGNVYNNYRIATN